MSGLRFLDTRVGTYSGLVMGPMLICLGLYLLFTPTEYLVNSGVPNWLPGTLMTLYGTWRLVRGVRGLRPRRDAEASPDVPQLSRTEAAVAQSRAASSGGGEIGAASADEHTDKDPA